ncbi:MAG: hypothetical protein IPP49_20625 [Saprospiraceae bacterium]|nr:hypothetical protein [Saprospiraceae bacterium]
MGLIHAEIELINAGDIALVRKNYIDQVDIKRITIDMIVDKSTYYLCINEEIQAQLQLSFVEKGQPFAIID